MLKIMNFKMIERTFPPLNIWWVRTQLLLGFTQPTYSYRKRHLNRAIRTMQEPNIIVKSGVYNYYIKLFVDNDNVKPHLQVVKVKSDGSFYVTNHKLNKKQADKIILEGQVLYDLSSLSDT